VRCEHARRAQRARVANGESLSARLRPCASHEKHACDARVPPLPAAAAACARAAACAMNLARARELGISKQLEPALRGVTHVGTPRSARRRRSRRASLDGGGDEDASGRAAPLSTDAAEAATAAAGDCSAPESEASDEDSCPEVAAGGASAEAQPANADALLDAEAHAAIDAVPAEAALVAPAAAAEPAQVRSSATHLFEEGGGAGSDALLECGQLDLANWMGQLSKCLRHTPMHRIRLPGTHDSGAYALSRRHMAPSKLPRWLLRLNRRAWWLTRPFSGLVARWGEAQVRPARAAQPCLRAARPADRLTAVPTGVCARALRSAWTSPASSPQARATWTCAS
jgi:hypothetical protein